MLAKYSKIEFINAMKSLGVAPGDTLFCHSNVGFLGMPEQAQNKQQALALLLEYILEVIGEDGTLVVPTFTYSFGKGCVFDPDNTPSNCGMFAEFVREQPQAIRSCDPSVSVAAIGAKAQTLVNDLPTNAYLPEAFFGRLHQQNGKIFNINFDAGSTFLHYVERQLNVSYRFDKTFHGQVVKQGEIIDAQSTLWVNDLTIEDSHAEFERFNHMATERGLYRRASVGRGSLGLIGCDDAYGLLAELIVEEPFILTGKGRAH